MQYCVVGFFCHTSTWISCRYAYVPSLLNLFSTSHSSIFAWEIVWTEEPVGLVRGVARSDTTECSCAHMVHITVSLINICTSRGSPSLSGRFPILFPLSALVSGFIQTWLFGREAAAEKCHQIYICFLLCTRSARKLTSPPQGRGAVTLPSYVTFQGPSLGSVWLQASESTSPFPPPAGEGALVCVWWSPGSYLPHRHSLRTGFRSLAPDSLAPRVGKLLRHYLNLSQGQPHDRYNLGLKCFN